MGNAVADLTMFNGSSKVFEIKTEFDSDKRLTMQLENYQKAFNQIFLIVPASKVKSYSIYDKNVGIITFDLSQEQRFTLYRKAKRQSIVDATTIMHILHTEEYKEIVQDYYGNLPTMTSFNQFKICSSLSNKIPNSKLNKYFIAQMKKRGSTNAVSGRYFKEFNQLSLALKMNKRNRRQMLQLLKSPIEE